MLNYFRNDRISHRVHLLEGITRGWEDASAAGYRLMPVWSIAPIADTPEVVLVSWAVHEVQLRPGGELTRHVVGEVGYGGPGQVSSAILHFHAAAAAFRTRSGRVYRVRGPDGLGKEGEYVWRAWLSRNPSHLPATDVTSEVAQAVAVANGFRSYADLLQAQLAGTHKFEAD